MADTLDFLLEIGCEEMPSAPLMNAAKQLPKLVQKRLDAAGLSHGSVRVVSSPRRLAAIVSDVAVATEAIDEVMRGPKAQIAFDADGNPTKAAAGFARKCDIEWPNYRSQRWGSEHETFVRPIRWICALLGSEVVPVTYADVTSGNVTRGHRVLAPGEHVVADPASYESVLEAAFVLSADRREEVIRLPRGHPQAHLRRGRQPLRVADGAPRHLRRGVPQGPAGDHLRVHALQPALLPDL